MTASLGAQFSINLLYLSSLSICFLLLEEGARSRIKEDYDTVEQDGDEPGPQRCKYCIFYYSVRFVMNTKKVSIQEDVSCTFSTVLFASILEFEPCVLLSV